MYSKSSLESRLTEIIPPIQRNTTLVVSNRKWWQRCTTGGTGVVVVISAHFTFSKHWFAVYAQIYYCYIPLWFFSPFNCKTWSGLFPYTYFVSDHTLHGKNWLCNIRRSCGPLNWSAATNWNYLLRRLILFQPKFSAILLIVCWHLSELNMQIEHARTPKWHNSWEKHQLLCIFIRNLRVDPYIKQYVSVSWSNSCFACIFMWIAQ